MTTNSLPTSNFCRCGLLLSVLMCMIPRGYGYSQQATGNGISEQSMQMMTLKNYGNNVRPMSNGAINFEIPIYVYKDEDFEIPLSLKYVSDGYRPGVQANRAGLGWALDVGGIITRTVIGIPDDQTRSGGSVYFEPGISPDAIEGFYTYHLVENPPINNMFEYPWNRGKMLYTEADYQMFHSTGGTNWGELPRSRFKFQYKATNPKDDIIDMLFCYSESTPDIFSFNFMGHSGKFVLGYNKQIHVFNTNDPYGEYRIDMSDFVKKSVNYTPSITIYTADGYVYTFGGSKSLIGLDFYNEYNVPFDPDSDSNIMYYPVYVQNQWPLTKIKAPNGRTVAFEYKTAVETTRYFGSSRSSIYTERYYAPSSELEGEKPSKQYGPRSSACDVLNYNVVNCYLTRIVIDDDAVIDLQHEARKLQPDVESALPRLQRIAVYNGSSASGRPVKQAILTHSYANDNREMFLSELKVNNDEVYTMEYYDGTFPALSELYVDHWGYYNGVSRTISYLGLTNYNDFNRIFKPNSNMSKLGMLKKVTYPTGGYSEFKYLGNSYRYTADNIISNWRFPQTIKLLGAAEPCGGVCLVDATDYSPDGKSYSRSFSYSDGVLNFYPPYKTDFIRKEQAPVKWYNKYLYTHLNRVYNIYCSPSLTRPIVPGPHIMYGAIYENFPDGSHILSEYNAQDVMRGNDVFDNFHYRPPFNDEMERIYIQRPSYDIFEGQLLRQTLFDKDFKMQHRMTWKYDKSKTPESISGGLMTVHVAYEYKIYVESYKLLKTIEENIEKSGDKVVSSQKEVTFAYNDKGQVISKSYLNSDGTSGAEKMLYLHDLNAVDLTASQRDMLENGFYKYPVKIKTTVGRMGVSYFTKGTKYEYMPVMNGENKSYKLAEISTTKMQIPITLDYFDFDHLLTPDVHYSYNKESRLTEQIDAAGIVTSYLWGYGNRYLIAEIKNASINDIEQVTGLNTNNLAVSPEPSSTEWVAVNSLRSKLKNTLVTTYRYQPMIGPVSIVDPAGRTIFYEYHKNGQMSEVKDDKSCPVQSFYYNYVTRE